MRRIRWPGWRKLAVAAGAVVLVAVTGLGNAVDPSALDGNTTGATTSTRASTTAQVSSASLRADTPRAGHARWVPPARPTWYWQLQGAIRTERAQVSDVDGFDTSAATVARLHADGQHVVCYIDAGTWENWRPDAARFPRRLLGRANGWPGERWLDIRDLAALEPIMSSRFAMCAHKGFDAVEPDNIDGYQNATGFPITAAQQLRYDEWLAREAHVLGLAVFQKNDPDQATRMQPAFDGALVEQCNQYQECGSFAAYEKAGKPVLNAEYEARLYPAFCTADRRRGIMGALYALSLNGSRYRPCW